VSDPGSKTSPSSRTSGERARVDPPTGSKRLSYGLVSPEREMTLRTHGATTSGWCNGVSRATPREGGLRRRKASSTGRSPPPARRSSASPGLPTRRTSRAGVGLQYSLSTDVMGCRVVRR